MNHRHQWESYGGCDSNPGCFDLGHGDMIFVKHCVRCGRVVVRGTNYAGQGPDWKQSFASVDDYLRGNPEGESRQRSNAANW